MLIAVKDMLQLVGVPFFVSVASELIGDSVASEFRGQLRCTGVGFIIF